MISYTTSGFLLCFPFGAKRKDFQDNLIEELKTITSNYESPIRDQLDEFSKSRAIEKKIYFKTIDPETNKPFFVIVLKQDLLDSGYNEWSGIKRLDLPAAKEAIINSNSKDIAEYISRIIDLLADGTVRIFPLIKGETGGYHVYERAAAPSGLKYFKYLPSKGYFEIDLSKKNPQDLLEFIGKLLFSDRIAIAIQDWDGSSTIADLQSHLDTNRDFITILSCNGHFGEGELLSLEIESSYILRRIIVENLEIIPTQSLQRAWNDLFSASFNIDRYLSNLMKDIRTRNTLLNIAIRVALYGSPALVPRWL